MAETDITLNVGLDVKDAEKTAEQLQKEIKDIFESRDDQPSASLTSLEMQMKQTVKKAQDLQEKLHELGNQRIPTQQYQELTRELEKATAYYDKLGEKSESMRSFDTAWQNSAKNVQKAQEKVNQLKADLEALHAQTLGTPDDLKGMGLVEWMHQKADLEMQESQYAKSLREAENELEKVSLAHQKLERQKRVWDTLQAETLEAAENVGVLEDKLASLEQSGQAFTIDTESYVKTQQELDKINDKLKQQIVHHKEITGKTKETRKETDKLKKSTDSVRKGFGNMAKFAKKALIAIGALTLGARGLMTMFSKLRSAILEGFQNLMNSDIGGIKKKIEDLKNASTTMKNALIGAFEPIVTMVIPYIQRLVQWLTVAIDKMAQFIAALSGQKTYVKAIKQVGDAAEKAGNQAKQALGPLDNLNVLTSPSSSGANNNMFEEAAISDEVFKKLDEMKKKFEELKKLADEIIIEPFKEGFNDAIGDWKGKIQDIAKDAMGVQNSLIEIFSNPDLQKANNDFIKQTSNTLGKIVGASSRIGLNLAQNIVGGLNKFLAENKGRIALDATELFTINTETMGQLGDFSEAIGQVSDAIGSDSGKGLTASVINLGYTIITEFDRISSKITRDAVEFITQPIIDNVGEIQSAVENLNLVVTPAIDGVAEAIQKDSESTNLAYDKYISPTIKKLQEHVSWFTEHVLKFWNDEVSPWLQDMAIEISSLWNNEIQPVLDEIKLTVGSVFQVVWDTVLEPVFNALKPAVIFIATVLWPLIKQVLTSLWDQVRIVFNFIDITLGGTLRTVRFVFDIIHDIITLDFEGLIEDTMSFIDDQRKRGQRFIQFFIDFFNDKIEKMQERNEKLKESFFGVIDAIKGKFEEWKTAMLGVIDTINNLVNAWKNGGITGLLSEVGNASSKIAGKTSNSKASFPGYANGQVIPPTMSKHLAILGDNNTETEVVSPLSTIRQAVAEAMEAMGGSGYGGTQEIVLQLDGREFMRAMVKQNNEYKKQHNGASALA